MAQCCLHKAQRTVAVDGMTGVGVPKSVATNDAGESCIFGGRVDNSEHLGWVQMTALATAKDRGIIGGTFAEGLELVPN